MNPIIKNIVAVVAGLIVGSIVNMAIVMVSGSIIPPPPGGDITTMEGLKATMHLFQPRNFIFPFLAHAIGTLVGALVTVKIAATSKLLMAMTIGLFFLVGGIINSIMLGGPAWFTAVDLIIAYIPMAYLAWKLDTKL